MTLHNISMKILNDFLALDYWFAGAGSCELSYQIALIKLTLST